MTPSEYTLLRRAKKSLGEFLEVLRDADIGSVMTFSLRETGKAANATQLAEAAESGTKEDNESSTTGSATINNPSELNLLTYNNKV